MYERFVQLLQENNITPYKVSKETGVTQTTLSDWKTGRGTPKAATLSKIAEYFGVTLDWLTGLSNYRNDQQVKAYIWEDNWASSDYYVFDPAFDFGPLLKPIREETGISIAEMADAISCTEDQYEEIEAGTLPITQPQAEKLCEQLDTNIIQVLDDNNLYDGDIPEEYWYDPKRYYQILREIDEEAQESMQNYGSAKLIPSEYDHIQKYRALDDRGRTIVDSVLDAEYKICAGSKGGLATEPETPNPPKPSAQEAVTETEKPKEKPKAAVGYAEPSNDTRIRACVPVPAGIQDGQILQQLQWEETTYGQFKQRYPRDYKKYRYVIIDPNKKDPAG